MNFFFGLFFQQQATLNANKAQTFLSTCIDITIELCVMLKKLCVKNFVDLITVELLSFFVVK